MVQPIPAPAMLMARPTRSASATVRSVAGVRRCFQSTTADMIQTVAMPIPMELKLAASSGVSMLK